MKTGERSVALRSDVYKNIGGNLNDIHSYLNFFGSWKELKPDDVIKRKREIDRQMYTYEPFFTKKMFETYKLYMNAAFLPYAREPGKDAKIRSVIESIDGNRRVHGPKPWQDEWTSAFTNEDNRAKQNAAYQDFLAQLKKDLKL